MLLAYINDSFSSRADEAVFVLALIICVLFYIEDRKCKAQMEKDEMLDHFLKDNQA